MNLLPLSLKTSVYSLLFVTIMLTSCDSSVGQSPNKKKTSNESIEKLNVQLKDFNLSYAQRQTIALEIKKKTGVLPWTPLSPQERLLRLEDQKETIKKYIQAFPKLKCYETDYFLFVSDAPKGIFDEITTVMDKMYETLCKVYNIPFEYILPDGTALSEDTKPIPKEAQKKRTNIWQSKCVVVVLMNENDFNHFELLFFENENPQGVTGICHQLSNGIVTITCKSSVNKYNFFDTLVHETTHGFTFMYRSENGLPLWLDEGMSDWAARIIVPQATNALDKQKEAVAFLRQNRTVEDMFTKNDYLQSWQYGASAMTVNMLIKKNPQAFVKLVDYIKDGKDAQKALFQLYHVNYAGLANALGRINGVRNVTIGKKSNR